MPAGARASSNAYAGLAPSEAIKQGADLGPLIAFLNANDPETLKIRTPVAILQGTADSTVLPPFTDQLDTALKANGAKVTYKKYDGVDHGGVVAAADADALAFAKTQLGR